MGPGVRTRVTERGGYGAAEPRALQKAPRTNRVHVH